jgi:hypothetical protein
MDTLQIKRMNMKRADLLKKRGIGSFLLGAQQAVLSKLEEQ